MLKKLGEEELRLLEKSGYSKRAVQLYVDKVNMGLIMDPDIVETHTGPCGDVIKLYLKVNKNGLIEDVKFNYLGCPGSAASTSAMTLLAKGKTIEEAKELTEDDILRELKGLPKPKTDCPKLALTTLRNAIAAYVKKRARRET